MTPIKFIILVFIALCFSCSKDDDSITSSDPVDPISTIVNIEKGVYALRDKADLLDIEADYVRILVSDQTLESIFNILDSGVDLQDIPDANEIVQIHSAGVKIILTVRWPDQLSTDPDLFDRVPLGSDRINSIDIVKRTLQEFGNYFDVFSLQNEVGGLGPGTYAEADMLNSGSGSNAVNWWVDIVNAINDEKASKVNLQHIKISSPVPIALKAMVFDQASLPPTNMDFFYETIEFGNTYTDYIDFHFNKYTLEEIDATIDFLTPLVQKPLISTEWSDVASAEGYLNLITSNVLISKASEVNYTIPSSITNEALIEHMYNSPCPAALWNFMVEESGYVEGFMAQSASKLAQANFEILIWNGGPQETSPLFNLRKIYATRTVSGDDNKTSILFDEFKQL